jgi:hypothetical protein
VESEEGFEIISMQLIVIQECSITAAALFFSTAHMIRMTGTWLIGYSLLDLCNCSYSLLALTAI